MNLTMALGIAVEFCAHPVHAFMEATGGRPARAAAALRSAGASVLCGIALTKLIGALSLQDQLCSHRRTQPPAWALPVQQPRTAQSAEVARGRAAEKLECACTVSG